MKPVNTFNILPGTHPARAINSLEEKNIFNLLSYCGPIAFNYTTHVAIFLASCSNFLTFFFFFFQQPLKFTHPFSSFCSWILNVFLVSAQFRDLKPHVSGCFVLFYNNSVLDTNFYVSFYCVPSHF